MADKQNEKMFRWFTVADYEEEEEFLREQHKNGCKVVKVQFPGIYTFEKCEPEDVLYRLDSPDLKKMDKESCLKIVSENGWKYLFNRNIWNYFCKPEDEEKSEEILFNDSKGKITIVEKTRKGMIPILVIFALFIVPQAVKLFTVGSGAWLENILLRVLLVVFICYAYLFFYYGKKLKELKRKYEI